MSDRKERQRQALMQGCVAPTKDDIEAESIFLLFASLRHKRCDPATTTEISCQSLVNSALCLYKDD